MRKNSYNDKQGGFRKIISFRCRTCASNDIQNVCIVCANICHADHDVEIIERFADSVFCDCGALGNTKCQSLAKRGKGGLKTISTLFSSLNGFTNFEFQIPNSVFFFGLI